MVKVKVQKANSKMMQSTRTGLSLLTVVITLFTFFFFFLNPERPICLWDYAYALEDEEQEIKVSYVRWACACPEWRIFSNNQESQISECTDCIFLEAVNDDYVTILNEINRNPTVMLKLRGAFYKTEGVSRNYQSPTSEHPRHGRVFRYTHFEIMN